jgi:hypothetical protein
VDQETASKVRRLASIEILGIPVVIPDRLLQVKILRAELRRNVDIPFNKSVYAALEMNLIVRGERILRRGLIEQEKSAPMTAVRKFVVLNADSIWAVQIRPFVESIADRCCYGVDISGEDCGDSFRRRASLFDFLEFGLRRKNGDRRYEKCCDG